jgi:formate dehydrogenase alpha subunit
VAGLAATFGSGAMTNSIAEIEDTKCIFIIGSNTSEAHPVISLRVMNAVHGAKLIVADPRRIRMVDFATLWLRQTPGTDIALVNGLLNIIISEGWLDREFIDSRTIGFEELEEVVKDYTPDKVSAITGISVKDLKEAAYLYTHSGGSVIMYCLGITEHTSGTNNVMSLANLAMATGNVGKPFTGVDPLRGQNNVQGACDMGALPNVFPGYQSVADEKLRANFERAWGVTLPPKPGLTIMEMMNAAADGKIKGMYIFGEDPVITDANTLHVAEGLSRLDFLVVEEMFMTDTAMYADVILPGASFAETDGTYTNTERRVQRIREAIAPIGDSRPNWQIISEVSTRLGYPMKYGDPSEILDEIAMVTPIYGGINFERIEKVGLQWPCRTCEEDGTMCLHLGQFSCGLGRFQPIPYKEPAEVPDNEYPFVFNNGRILFHYHNGTMTRNAPGLDAIRPEAELDMNPADAEKMGVTTGDWVEIASRRSKVRMKVKVTEKSTEGLVYSTFHFREAPINQLTSGDLDPTSKTPGYKMTAVKITPVK